MSEHNDSGGGEWAASESKDWKDGRHRRENKHVYAHAGEIRDRSSRRHVSIMKAAYERAHRRGWLEDGWPASFEETELYRERMGYHATEGFSERLADGDAAGIRHYVGSQKDEPDVSGIRVLRTLEDLIGSEAAMLYLFGHMGNGKTFFACLLAELWHGMMGEHAEIATNIRTLEAADHWIADWPSLKEWMEEDEDTVLAGNQTPKLFILDEASSQASGRGKDGWDAATKLAVMCYKIRKYGGALIIIGHDGKDVAPAVRELCTACHKTGQKTAQFFRSVKNREGRDPLTEPLKGIPLPDKSWQPNTNDLAPWSWSTDEEEIEDEQAFKDMAIWTIIKCRESGLSTRDTAEIVPYGKTTVGNVWKAYQEEGKHRDTVDSVEEVFA